MERIYQFIESYMPEGYVVSWQNLDENSENQIGIFLYQGQADKRTLDGIEIENIKVHIEMLCRKAEYGVITGMNDLRKAVITLQDAVSQINGLTVLNIKVLNKVLPIGRNEHGIPKVVSNLELSFNLENGE